MPKNQVNDLITDQEMEFARLVLSGTMTDREAAQAAGLNPDTAAYTKAKPRVRTYMIEFRAAVQAELVAQETEAVRRKNLRREQVLDRLWEYASMSPEMTRGSITGQVKALSIMVAIEGLIPDRRAASSKKESTPPPEPQIYKAAWLREQEENDTPPEPSPANPAAASILAAASIPQEEDEPGHAEAEPSPTSGSAADAPSKSPFDRSSSSETAPSAPFVPPLPYAPDTRIPFSIKQNPFKFLR